ncbi:MAG: hypothetical protein ACREU3_03930 [Steroidobacteraceae bacterium]
MDAVGDTFARTEEAIRAAQEKLAQTEQLARLDNDATAPALRAQHEFLGSTLLLVGELRRTAKELVEGSRPHPALEPGVVREIQESLANLGEKTGDTVAKKIEPALIASVARGAKGQLAVIAQGVWWRVLAIGSAIPVLALLLGVGVGYWRGRVAGYGEAASTIEASGPVEKAVLAAHGPEALHRWHQLMRDNDILATMKQDCKGKSVQRQDGRTACNLWLWTTPYVAPTPHG